MQRENFKSRTGFLLVSAGCAIGIGNVWRFPYVTGENGGGLAVDDRMLPFDDVLHACFGLDVRLLL